LQARRQKKGSTMYVLSDPNAKAHLRMIKAVKDEGMPTLKNPFIHGNLFLLLTIEFPDTLTPEAQKGIRSLLPPPLNAPKIKESDEGVEVHNVTDIDPVQSYNSNKINMSTGGDSAYDDDDDDAGGGGMRGPGGQQCQQM
jgi:DnaJ family protein A protein 2